MKWVRPLIVLLLAVVVSVGFFMGKVAAEAYVAFATGLIVFWFKSRDDDKVK